MHLYHLLRVSPMPAGCPTPRRYTAFVIRAKDEARAREVAARFSNDPRWNGLDHATCIKLIREGPEEVIQESFEGVEL